MTTRKKRTSRREVAFADRLTDKRRRTPALFLDLDAIVRNYEALRRSFGSSFEVFFSVKANDDVRVLRTLARLGSGFDVASLGEIRRVLSLGVGPEKIAFSNPVKIPQQLAAARRAGVDLFAFDSEDEIRKLSALAPGAQVYLRLEVDNHGSGWPLSGKFGASPEKAPDLLAAAAAAGLDPVGLTFHVGSQCVRIDNWRSALLRCRDVWREAQQRGLKLRLLDIGGGLPAAYDGTEPAVSEIGPVVAQMAKELLPGLERLIIEPGRFLVANAGTLLTTVIGRAERNGKTIVFLDVGIFNGLMETYEAFWYRLERLGAASSDKTETVTLVGPSCDSVDVIAKDISLPRLEVGDRVIFHTAGAYTNSYKTYNGFSFPRIIICGE
ncbi:MAG: type III PLP-dependent enzyme [Patescibacteria group bacterium]|jgi:ornithine decarboxylase